MWNVRQRRPSLNYKDGMIGRGIVKRGQDEIGLDSFDTYSKLDVDTLGVRGQCNTWPRNVAPPQDSE